MPRNYVRRMRVPKSLTIVQQRRAAENTGLVGTIAKEFLGRGLTLDELVADGMVGLCQAAIGFDESRGTAFGTYAGPWIKQAIRQGLSEIRLIHVPQHRSAAFGGEWDAAKALKFVSLSDPGLGTDMDTDVPEPILPTPDDEAEGRLAALRVAIADLPPRHRAVVKAMLEETPKDEVAERLGVCRKWIYTLEHEAVAKLRAALVGPEESWSTSLLKAI